MGGALCACSLLEHARSTQTLFQSDLPPLFLSKQGYTCQSTPWIRLGFTRRRTSSTSISGILDNPSKHLVRGVMAYTEEAMPPVYTEEALPPVVPEEAMPPVFSEEAMPPACYEEAPPLASHVNGVRSIFFLSPFFLRCSLDPELTMLQAGTHPRDHGSAVHDDVKACEDFSSQSDNKNSAFFELRPVTTYLPDTKCAHRLPLRFHATHDDVRKSCKALRPRNATFLPILEAIVGVSTPKMEQDDVNTWFTGSKDSQQSAGDISPQDHSLNDEENNGSKDKRSQISSPGKGSPPKKPSPARSENPAPDHKSDGPEPTNTAQRRLRNAPARISGIALIQDIKVKIDEKRTLNPLDKVTFDVGNTHSCSATVHLMIHTPLRESGNAGPQPEPAARDTPDNDNNEMPIEPDAAGSASERDKITQDMLTECLVKGIPHESLFFAIGPRGGNPAVALAINEERSPRGMRNGYFYGVTAARPCTHEIIIAADATAKPRVWAFLAQNNTCPIAFGSEFMAWILGQRTTAAMCTLACFTGNDLSNMWKNAVRLKVPIEPTEKSCWVRHHSLFISGLSASPNRVEMGGFLETMVSGFRIMAEGLPPKDKEKRKEMNTALAKYTATAFVVIRAKTTTDKGRQVRQFTFIDGATRNIAMRLLTAVGNNQGPFAWKSIATSLEDLKR